MFKILIVSPDSDSLSGLVSGLKERDDVDLTLAESGGIALEMISVAAVDLVAVDEKLGDMTGLEFLKKLLSINPMVNSALANPLPPEEFHEVSEGMGVLVQLPVKPGKDQAEKLVQCLEKVTLKTNQ